MITEVPNDTPVTIPVVPVVKACVLLLLHVPPPGVELSVVVKPTQIESMPCMAVGFGLTVTTAVLIHPVAGMV